MKATTLATLTNPKTATARDCTPHSSPETPDWLLGDLAAVIDYCVQEGDYETVEAIMDLDECGAQLYALAHQE